jgi:hypothetical protein
VALATADFVFSLHQNNFLIAYLYNIQIVNVIARKILNFTLLIWSIVCVLYCMSIAVYLFFRIMQCVWISFFILMTLTFVDAEDRDDWIDPNDMLNFDPSTNTMKKKKVSFVTRKSNT